VRTGESDIVLGRWSVRIRKHPDLLPTEPVGPKTESTSQHLRQERHDAAGDTVLAIRRNPGPSGPGGGQLRGVGDDDRREVSFSDGVVGDPWARLELALTRLYDWFRATQAMQRHVHHDRHLVPDLDQLLKETLDARLDAGARIHAARLGGGRPRLLGH
jgi:hypothetical protein